MERLISGKKLWWLFFIFTAIWFSNLEYRKLIKPDEGRYAEIPREMVASGDWVTPRLNDLKYFEKPPLQYWATAVAYEAFGEHQWTSRLWTGLTGFAGVLLVWFVGLRLFGREAAFYAAVLLASSSLYAMMSHINTLDIGVTFFMVLGIAGLMLGQTGSDAKQQRGWMVLAWAALAFAVLSKGLIGIVLPGAALFIYMVVQRDFSVLKRMHWLGGLTIFLLITVPWFYLVMKANPEFFHFFFIHEHFERFTTKEHGRYQPWYYFILIMLVGMLPWTGLMLDTLWKSLTGKRIRPVAAMTGKPFDAGRFLMVWTIFVFVFFSISDSKLPSYVLPIFPSLALLMGRYLADMPVRRLFWIIAPVLPVALIAVALAPFTAKLADNPLRVEIYGQYAWWLFAGASVWLLGTGGALWLLRRNHKPGAVLALAFAFFIAGQLATSGYNTIARERSAYLLAEELRPYIKPGEPLYSIQMYEQTLPFYLKRTFTLVEFKDELEFGIGQEPQRWIPDIPAFAKAWQAQPQALAIMPIELLPEIRKLNLDMKVVLQDTQYAVIVKP